ncbi:MAG: hypothetical protein UY28_C0004G0033 [Candidatus Amesbacteria bacterium GW2011_GWB1_48_13]|uniref:Uncharacterized protein n=1 Tax=Candidatus Amesbacteria bacterium GW2011_GWB1_48_13 TaxID=1618362 RepID=A0A0G1XVG2_9BACT|nr:MAG: hypothetical protein UY28_C0004G0033 [Candidatus Amesbacteria bacterium GW2011_GWB1_48_13]
MAQRLPNFNPPRYQPPPADLNTRFKDFLTFWQQYNQYVVNYMQRVGTFVQTLSGSDVPFEAIASAASITPLQAVQPVTGTATISDINAPDDFIKLTLLSIDGFSVATGGNLTVAKTLAAGESLSLVKNLSNGLWYSFIASQSVEGPTSGPSTDKAVVRFDGVTGKKIQNSGVVVNDQDDITLPGEINHDGTKIGFNGAAPVTQSTGWNISNVTLRKTYNADLTTLNELADAVGTMINYLKSRGDFAA